MLHVLVISLIEHPWNKIKLNYGCSKKEKRWHDKEAWPKKKRKGVAMSQKKEKETRDDLRDKTIRSKPHPSIHPSTHTPAPFWSRLHDLFLHGSSLWLYNIWNASTPFSYATLSSTKTFVVVGEIKGKYCPGEENTSWVPQESYHGNFVIFSKIFQKVPPDRLRIYEQVSTTLCTVLTLNSPRQGDSWEAPRMSKVIVQMYNS